MSFWSAIVLISLFAMISGVINARYRAQAGIGQDGAGRQYRLTGAEDEALREEVKELRERVKVLERIVTEDRGANAIAHEIERLRDG